ncbi:MAG: hypothetical protein AVDCRST_MAG48-1164, partial [uncultured Friedmanniella sp.]
VQPVPWAEDLGADLHLEPA